MFSDVDDILSTDYEALPRFADDIQFDDLDVPKKRTDHFFEEETFGKGSSEYKKARKRRQNRESAMRARFRKRV
jgi:hypothetical protein